MQAQRKPNRVWVAPIVAGTLLASLSGCGPIAFSDGSALAISGDAPAPEPEPEPQKRVEVIDDRIVIHEKVQFEFNSAKILEVSHSLLSEVAQTIKDNPQIKKVEVQGHASAEGADDYNLKLSDKRAHAVMEYLVGAGGLNKEMLQAKGFGETKPIADNETEEGREKNRRVEFHILDQIVTQKKVEVDDSGNKTVIEEKKVEE
jgi:OOP family OmpA-OmpF porin